MEQEWALSYLTIFCHMSFTFLIQIVLVTPRSVLSPIVFIIGVTKFGFPEILGSLWAAFSPIDKTVDEIEEKEKEEYKSTELIGVPIEALQSKLEMVFKAGNAANRMNRTFKTMRTMRSAPRFSTLDDDSDDGGSNFKSSFNVFPSNDDPSRLSPNLGGRTVRKKLTFSQETIEITEPQEHDEWVKHMMSEEHLNLGKLDFGRRDRECLFTFLGASGALLHHFSLIIIFVMDTYGLSHAHNKVALAEYKFGLSALLFLVLIQHLISSVTVEPITQCILLLFIEVVFQINAIGLIGHSRTQLTTVATFNLLLSHWMMAMFYLMYIPCPSFGCCSKSKPKTKTKPKMVEESEKASEDIIEFGVIPPEKKAEVKRQIGAGGLPISITGAGTTENDKRESLTTAEIMATHLDPKEVTKRFSLEEREDSKSSISTIERLTVKMKEENEDINFGGGSALSAFEG